MKWKRVLIVEPSFYGVKFVEAAQQLGCEVIAVVSDRHNPVKYGYQASYADLIIADVRDADSVYQAIVTSPYAEFDAIIPATDYATEVTARVAQRMGKFTNPVVATQRARNKDLAREQYEAKGVPSAHFKVVSNVEEALRAAQQIGYPLVLKPTNTASSIAVFLIRNHSELTLRLQEIRQLKTSYLGFAVRPQYLMEEFLQGPEFSVELFLQHDQIAFAEVTDKQTTVPPFFVELTHIFPTLVTDKTKTAIINTAYEAAQALEFHDGPLHIEIKLTADGPRVVEVNGRPGGDQITSDLISQATGINLFEQTVRLYLQEPTDLQRHKSQHAATVFFCAEQPGVLKGISGWDELAQQPAVVRTSLSKSLGDKVRPPENSDDRIGYAIVCCETVEMLLTAIDQVKQLVKVQVDSN